MPPVDLCMVNFSKKLLLLLMNNLGIYTRLFFESILFSFQALWSNKLRTFLSLSGVTIGIFAIISVFTLVDSLKNEIKGSVESLGDNILFVQKWPWSFGSEYPWWKYWNRPVPDYNEFKWLQKEVTGAQAVCMIFGFQRSVTYKGKTVKEATTAGVTFDFDQVRSFEIVQGRYFSSVEAENGNAVCVIGYMVNVGLFGGVNPIGKRIKVGGKSVEVIGVFKEEGDNVFSESLDYQVVLPLAYARTIVDIQNSGDPVIMVRAKPKVPLPLLKEELRGAMRAVRKLKPKAEDSFALNEPSLLSNALDELFKVINLTGLIIGLFSILVGGFSIANIMFVSVKERTNIIGIQKSLGAKNDFILFQFLAEAIILCVLGGGFGLLIIAAGTFAISAALDIGIYLSISNVFLGLGISVAIGIASGLLPALSASRLSPVEAIRAKG